MRGFTAAAVMISIAAGGPAWAAVDCSALLNQGYTCAVPIASGQPVGELARLGAGVQNTGTAGFTPVTRNLNVGDRFNVGSSGSTFITAGPECQSLQLPANAAVSVTEINGCAAVKIENNPTTAGGDNGAAMGLGVAAVGAGVVAGFVLLNNKASP